MTNTDKPIHIAYVPDKFTFEYIPDKLLTLDIVDSELVIESFIEEEGTTTQKVLSSIQSWIKETHEVELTTSSAWSLWQAVRMAYEAHKKKLLHSLSSAIATASIPSSLPQEESSP